LRLCSATTKAGAPCQRPAQGHNEFCLGHDPAKASERRRTASRGGRGRKNTEVRAVKQLMRELTAKVLSGDLEPSILYAAVAAQNTLLKAIEIERRLEETDVAQEFDELSKVLHEQGILS
jgi:hypothetical protein